MSVREGKTEATPVERLVRLWGRWLEAAVVFWCPWVLLLELPARPLEGLEELSPPVGGRTAEPLFADEVRAGQGPTTAHTGLDKGEKEDA